MINDNFSLMRGGLVYRFLHAIGAIKPDKRTTPWVAALLTGLALVPIVLATTFDGTLHGDRVTMPLLGDYAVLARFLIAVPMLILVAPQADALLREAIAHFPRSGLVHGGTRAQFDAVIDQMVRLRDSNVPELLCLLVALLPLMFQQASFSMLHGIDDWRIAEDGQASFAGMWLNAVAVPVFRFVGLIWIWRLCLWTYLLWRLARIDLELSAAHPDGAGGLAFLGVAQYRFSVLALAGGILLAGSCIDQIVYLGATLNSLKHLLIGYVVVVTLLLSAPLLMMCPRLLALKRTALMNYGTLGHAGAHGFDQRWLGSRSSNAPSMLDANDPSSVADFGAVYNTIRSMSVVPMTRYNLLWIAMPALLPMIPVLFFAMPLDALLQKMVSILV